MAAYNEVLHWRKNFFPVPYGSVGKRFVSETSRLYRAYAAASSLEGVALAAACIMPTLLLQNPSSTSKTVVHIEYLERRLDSWEKGDINALVEEGRSIQRHLKPRPTSRKVQTSLANRFARLMFKGDTAGAIRMLSSSSSGGVLHLHEQLDSTSGGPATVLDALKKKHPPPQSLSSQAVIPGEPPLPPHPAYYD